MMKIAVTSPRSSGIDLVLACLDAGHEVVVAAVEQSTLIPWLQGLPFVSLGGGTARRDLEDLRVEMVMAGSEEAVGYTNDLALDLGLPHHDPGKSAARRHKDQMIQALATHDIAAPKSYEIHNVEEFDQLDLDGGLVLKPPASSGSDLVQLCDGPASAREGLVKILGSTDRFGAQASSVVVQERLYGPMMVVNTVSRNGCHLVTDVYNKTVSERDQLPISESLVLAHPDGLDDLLAYTFDCLDALGIANGPAHTEIIITQAGPRLVEVNSRLMGPAMPRDIFVPALGYSQASVAVEAATDLKQFVKRLQQPYTIAQYLGQTQLRPHQSGTLTSVTGLDRVRKLPGFAGIAKTPLAGIKTSEENLSTATTGIAYFRSTQRQIVEESIAETRRLCDSGAVFEVAM